MDVTAHEIGEDDNIKEIYPPTGGDYGGTKVDKEFKGLMENVFGKDFMDKFCRDHPSDWLDLMNDFELKKRAERVMKQEVTRIGLPNNFINLWRHENGENDNSIIRQHYKEDEVKVSKGRLWLGSKIVENLFEPAIASIISHLKKLLKQNALRGIKLLFLVGGFSESPLLQARIRQEFNKKYNILIPQDAQTAVVKGAVMFGKHPHVVVERCLAETYGIMCYQDFDWEEDKREYLEWIENKAKCKNIFSVLAKQHDKVRIGQCKESSKYHPIRADQTELSFKFFTSTNPNVRYTTDDGVRELPGYITISSPDTSKGTKRDIQLRMYFETEIKVVAVDLESGNEAFTFIDFLAQE